MAAPYVYKGSFPTDSHLLGADVAHTPPPKVVKPNPGRAAKPLKMTTVKPATGLAAAQGKTYGSTPVTPSSKPTPAQSAAAGVPYPGYMTQAQMQDYAKNAWDLAYGGSVDAARQQQSADVQRYQAIAQAITGFAQALGGNLSGIQGLPSQVQGILGNFSSGVGMNALQQANINSELQGQKDAALLQSIFSRQPAFMQNQLAQLANQQASLHNSYANAQANAAYRQAQIDLANSRNQAQVDYNQHRLYLAAQALGDKETYQQFLIKNGLANTQIRQQNANTGATRAATAAKTAATNAANSTARIRIDQGKLTLAKQKAAAQGTQVDVARTRLTGTFYTKDGKAHPEWGKPILSTKQPKTKQPKTVFGTAPHKNSDGVWVTKTGRPLNQKGQNYWNGLLKRGVTDGNGYVKGGYSKPAAPKKSSSSSLPAWAK